MLHNVTLVGEITPITLPSQMFKNTFLRVLWLVGDFLFLSTASADKHAVLVIARSAYSHPGALESKCSSVRASVRKKDDFCEGYKRLGQGQIRLDNFSEVKSGY